MSSKKLGGAVSMTRWTRKDDRSTQEAWKSMATAAKGCEGIGRAKDRHLGCEADIRVERAALARAPIKLQWCSAYVCSLQLLSLVAHRASAHITARRSQCAGNKVRMTDSARYRAHITGKMTRTEGDVREGVKREAECAIRRTGRRGRRAGLMMMTGVCRRERFSCCHRRRRRRRRRLSSLPLCSLSESPWLARLSFRSPRRFCLSLPHRPSTGRPAKSCSVDPTPPRLHRRPQQSSPAPPPSLVPPPTTPPPSMRQRLPRVSTHSSPSSSSQVE